MDNGALFTDGSRLIMESLVQAGSDAFVGYPITPANLLYLYASQRFTHFTAAPDEITTLQLMSGYAAAGRLPVTATSFPGFALMLEGINMAFMMELPMVIILVQRLGPATGTATLGAQGDMNVLTGTLSGGMVLPSFGISTPVDCWEIPARALEVAVRYRTPVVILTSKEEVMTQFSLDPKELKPVDRVKHKLYDSDEPYRPYEPGADMTPAFLPVTDDRHQVRLTASTHDRRGIIQNSSVEALENSMRLHHKVAGNVDHFTWYELDEQEGAGTLVMSYGITAQASREAVVNLRNQGVRVSLLVAKTLLPVPPVYDEICARYRRVVIAEENLTGQYRQVMFGQRPPERISGVNQFGKMIMPETIEEEVLKNEQAVS